MKKFNLGFLGLALAVALSTFAQAGSFSVVGGGVLPDGTLPGAVGVLDIVYNPAPQNASFANGGIALAIQSGTPGVIKFTGASVLNPAGRWTVVQVQSLTDNAVGVLNGFSVGSPGLPTAGNSIYAQINYEVIGVGTTQLSLNTQGEDPIFDGVQGDLSSVTALIGGPLTVNPVGPVIPEPASLAMAGMGLIGLAFRRRNG